MFDRIDPVVALTLSASRGLRDPKSGEGRRMSAGLLFATERFNQIVNRSKQRLLVFD
ncbi:MAG: hypothetical protein AAGI12_13415 [Pseudomonadota bacterium]